MLLITRFRLSSFQFWLCHLSAMQALPYAAWALWAWIAEIGKYKENNAGETPIIWQFSSTYCYYYKKFPFLWAWMPPYDRSYMLKIVLWNNSSNYCQNLNLGSAFLSTPLENHITSFQARYKTVTPWEVILAGIAGLPKFFSYIWLVIFLMFLFDWFIMNWRAYSHRQIKSTNYFGDN